GLSSRQQSSHLLVSTRADIEFDGQWLDYGPFYMRTLVPLSIQFWTSSAEITINCIPSVHSLSPISQHFSLTTVGPSTTNSSPTSTIFNSRSMSLTRQCETCD
ncbi:unnamed protein product, partial [Fusarium fujikuroi]